MSATSEAECTAHQPRNAVDGQVETEAQQVEAMLLSRAYLYTLFHKCFGGVPTAELLQVLEGGVTADVVDEYAEDDAAFAALKAFLGDLARADQAQLLESARDEYTRLFIGPANLPASPYESPYTGAHDLALFNRTRWTYGPHTMRRVCALSESRRCPTTMCRFCAPIWPNCRSARSCCFVKATSMGLHWRCADRVRL